MGADQAQGKVASQEKALAMASKGKAQTSEGNAQLGSLSKWSGKNQAVAKVGTKLRRRRGRQHLRDTLHFHHHLQGQHLRQRRVRRRPARSPEPRIAGSGGGGSGAPAKNPWSPRALPIAPARPGWRIAGGRGVGNQNPSCVIPPLAKTSAEQPESHTSVKCTWDMCGLHDTGRTKKAIQKSFGVDGWKCD